MEIEWLGPYQIVGMLGRGGMGTVYEGVHRETGEAAAIKLLSAALAQEEGFRVRFEGEIETLRKLRHPNIVRLFGFGQQEGQLFYSMELVDGNSLEEELRRGRQFDWREVAQIGMEMCRALRHAHDRGVIHRDIKPANLLVTADGHVKLSDFGIARLFGNARLTMAGNVVGTAEYMPPEQASGQPVDVRADLYSLGAVLYTLLARRPVFRGKSLPELLHKQRFEQPDPLRKHAPDAPAEFECILRELLEKEPSRRIPNAGLLGRRLEAMVRALSVDRETVEADAAWFVDEEESPTAEAGGPATPVDDIATAATLDRPVRDLPPTQVLPADEPRTATLENVPLVEEAATRTGSDGFSGSFTERGSFVHVREEELDAVEEEPRPAIISWQTGVLGAALIAVGLSVWWFLQPPTADALYQRIEARMNGEPPPQKASEISEVEGIISDFSVLYPRDHRIGRLRKYEKDLRLRRLEWDFNRRITGKNGAEGLSSLEQMYLEAINDARFAPARSMVKLQSLIDLYGDSENDSDSAGLCLTLARKRLEQIRVESERHAAEQLDGLRARLDAADELRQSEPERARKIYRAVIDLYGNKAWAAEVVGRARNALAKEGVHQ